MGSFYTTEPFPGFTSTPKKTYAGTKEFKKLFHLLLCKEKKIKADKNASYLIATDELSNSFYWARKSFNVQLASSLFEHSFHILFLPISDSFDTHL